MAKDDAGYVSELEDRIRRLETRLSDVGGSPPSICARRFSADTTVFDTVTPVDLTGGFPFDQEVINLGGYTWESSTKRLHVPSEGVYQFGMYGRYIWDVNGGGAGYSRQNIIWDVYSSQQTAEQYADIVMLDGDQFTEVNGGFLNIISAPVELAASDWIKGATSVLSTSGPAGLSFINVYGGSGDEQLTLWIEKLDGAAASEPPSGTPSSLTYIPMTLFGNATPVGSFGNPAVAIDRGVVYISGAVALDPSTFQNGSDYGYIPTASHPEIDTYWPPVVGTRRYGGLVADFGGTNPINLRPVTGVMSNTGDGKLRFGCYVNGVNAAAFTGPSIYQDVVVRLAPPAA